MTSDRGDQLTANPPPITPEPAATGGPPTVHTASSKSASELSIGEVAAEGFPGGFDSLRPPPQARLDECVHCGFCLPACPTYVLWGDEMDSPRGRIELMKGAAEGRLTLDRTFRSHIDACLGCMACMTACPSGVAYDELIEATRAQVERHVPSSLTDRLVRKVIFALFPYPGRVRVAALGGKAWKASRPGRAAQAALARRLPAQFAAMESLMPDRTFGQLLARTPRRSRPTGEARRRVGLLTGCVASVFFSHVNDAARAVLVAEGCEVLAPRQGCCGALSFHAGRDEQGRALARATIDTWESTGIEALIIDAAGCGSTVKEYGRLLADDPQYAARAAALAAKAVDVTEFIADLEPRAERHPIHLRVAYHDACHLAHAQGVRAQPRTILASIPGLEVLPIPEAEMCCGSAGIYNIVQPAAAADLGIRKAAAVRSTSPDIVASANPGCLLQMGKHLGDLPLVHPIEVLAASLEGSSPWVVADGDARPFVTAKPLSQHPTTKRRARGLARLKLRALKRRPA